MTPQYKLHQSVKCYRAQIRTCYLIDRKINCFYRCDILLCDLIRIVNVIYHMINCFDRCDILLCDLIRIVNVIYHMINCLYLDVISYYVIGDLIMGFQLDVTVPSLNVSVVQCLKIWDRLLSVQQQKGVIWVRLIWDTSSLFILIFC